MGNCYSIKTTSEEDTAASEEGSVSNPVEDENNNVGGAYVYASDLSENRDREFQDRSRVANSALDHAIRAWIVDRYYLAQPGAWSPRPNNARRNPSAPRMQNGLGEAFEMINSSLEADAALTVLDENSSTGEMTKSSVAADDESSSAGICIRCPVCLDGLPVISSTGRSLMSTVCGHIFCSRCIPASIRSNGRCPTCRRILFFPYHVHPIFI